MTVTKFKIFARCHENCQSVAEFKTVVLQNHVYCCACAASLAAKIVQIILLPPYTLQCKIQHEIRCSFCQIQSPDVQISSSKPCPSSEQQHLGPACLVPPGTKHVQSQHSTTAVGFPGMEKCHRGRRLVALSYRHS